MIETPKGESRIKMRGSVADATQVFHEKNEIYNLFLAVLDYIFSAFVITPAVVGCWRSQWELLEIYCYPNDKVLSATISTVIGLAGNVFLNFMQKPLDGAFHPDVNRVLYYVVSRTYSIFYAFVCVNWFKGVWQLLDAFTPGDALAVSLATGTGIIILAFFRSLRNISAPPLVVASDERIGYFQVLTIFRVSSSEKRVLYVLDCIFSATVIGTLVVSVWRGGFQLLDLLVYPDNKLLSYWVTLILGYGVVIIAFLLQSPTKWICDHLPMIPRLIFGDLFIIFSSFGTINTWRGMWDLLNYYFLPGTENLYQKQLSCWLIYWVSLIFLILMGCSNSLLVRGVFIDAEEPGGDSMIFPCHFVRNLLSKQREEKNMEKLKQISTSSNKDEKSNLENHNSNFVYTVQLKEFSA